MARLRMARALHLSAVMELLKNVLSRPAPRYTSYPAVPHWDNAVTSADLGRAIAQERDPVAVYLHVPFCWKDCTYCGCNRVISTRQSAGGRYLRAMERQIDALPLGLDPMPLARLHLGGGTPTWLDPVQLGSLLAMVGRRFVAVKGSERSIEVHPGVTSAAHLDVLAAEGFNRLSIGVQSTDPQVLAGIGRVQAHTQVCDVAQGARERGFDGVNIDLVYGLPHQTLATLERTLDQVLEIRPDRLALYGYAHVPWLRANQRKIDESALPDTALRTELFLYAAERLQREGWLPLGMDHFARPEDPLCQAAQAGRLSRDFMGYTDRAAPLIALGPSAISEIGGLYAQQPAHLGEWYRAIEGGDLLPVVRGHRLSADDRRRSAAIRELMCHLRVPAPLPEGVEGRLGEWEDLGVLERTGDGIAVNERGRLVLKNIAACFDAYLGSGTASWRIDPRGDQGSDSTSAEVHSAGALTGLQRAGEPVGTSSQ